MLHDSIAVVASSLHVDITSQTLFVRAVKDTSAPSAGLLGTGLEKVVETLFPVVALLALGLVIVLLIRLFPSRRVRLVLDVAGDEIAGKMHAALMERLAQLVDQLSTRQQSAPAMWLTWLSAVTDLGATELLPSGGPDASQVTLKLGPAEFGVTRRFVYRLLRRSRTCDLHIHKYSANDWVAALQTDQGSLVHQVFKDTPEDLDRVATHVLAALSVGSKRTTTADVRLLQGVFTMCRFFDPPYLAKHLRAAILLFDEAARDTRLRLGARLLAASAAQLAQDAPNDALRRTHEVAEDKGWADRDKYVLEYQLGLAEFYTYKPEGYMHAKEHLKQIPEPSWLVTTLAQLGVEQARRRLLLYLLAQSDLAIVMAHFVKPDSFEDDRKAVERTVEEVKKLARRWRHCHLGTGMEAVEWRCLNALVCLEVLFPQDLEAGKRRAREALLCAPYALDVKANLGRLLMLQAKAAESANQSADRSRYLNDAKLVFDELLGTGWDPGYLNYRLAQISCAFMNFGDAQRFLDAASGPDVKDVGDKYLAAVQKSINDRASTIL